MKYMNDKWILIIGIPTVGIIMPLVFNKFSFDFLLTEGYRNLLFSMFTTIAIWLGVRKIVIELWIRYPWEKHPLKHLIYEILLVFSYTMIVGFVTFIIYRYSGFLKYEEEFSLEISIAITLLVTFFITSLHEAWFFYNQWNISLLKAKALEKENIQSQYETLKSQVNPHFLFNTLNTLTTLIEESPKVAVGYVEKTADFLRGLLNMKDKEIITLKEEMGIIETFYELQKERFGTNLMIRIDVDPALLEKKIPPLALQMLVENAIKHNIISSELPLTITVDTATPGFVSVKNNLQRKPQENNSSRIGLQNIRNRYEFLSDGNVEVSETSQFFEVKLPLLNA
jgi:two-component system, LytTR family, sensor kinase